MAGDDLIGRSERVMAPNYGAPALSLVDGDGAFVRDAQGREYIDFGTGISVTSFGHRHPAIRAAIDEQLERLWHTSNLYVSEAPLALAEDIVAASFAERVFFCNSGTEAMEAAIKTVRRAASASRPPERREILTFEGGFHGRTLAALSATAQPRYHEGFEPLPAGFRYCAFNDINALAKQLDDDVCAVIVEPIQGEGGIVPAEPGFLRRLRELCDERGALLVFDEIQCGMARTGRLWAHEWEAGVIPDAMTLAKALGGGLPIGALALGPRLAATLAPGSHGSTFGGNPVACAAARAALKLARSAEILANVERQSETLRAGLSGLADEFQCFETIRGRGLMIGAVLTRNARERLVPLLAACLDEGLMLLQAGGGVLRFLPPLNVDGATMDAALQRLRRALTRVFA